MEAIAERAEVSKATVYRWWPNRAAVVMDGFLSTVSSEVPFPHTGHAREDIRIHMRRLAEAFSGKLGRTVAALIAEGQTDPELAEALRSRWLSVRRAEAREILELGIERGELERTSTWRWPSTSFTGPSTTGCSSVTPRSTRISPTP